VAGWVGNLHQCVHLELKWKELLERYGLKYFKASEQAHGTGQFAQYRDDPGDPTRPWSKKEKEIFKEIKTAFVDATVYHNIIGIGTVLMLPDYERIKRETVGEDNQLPEPYYLCAVFTLLEAGQIMNHWNATTDDKALLKPIFDSQEEYSGTMKAAFDGFAKNNPISCEYLLPPDYEDDEMFLMLQAADNYVYETRKLLIQSEYDKGRMERIAMQRLKERSRRIYKLNYKALRMVLAAQQQSDVIPIKAAIENDLELEL
jgi:hypothetical protein